jgi:hypothetical protein
VAYDPSRPASIFEGNNLVEFMKGLNNAQMIRLGIEGGDVSRSDLGVCMVALSDTTTILSPSGDSE